MPSSKRESASSKKKKRGGAASSSDEKIRSRSRTPVEPVLFVGIGASAGGLEAADRFFRSMPEDSGMAFVLVTHLDPRHESSLPQLIQRATRMQVLQIEDGMKAEANRVYVLPPNRDLGILHGTLQLTTPLGSAHMRAPIDTFFRLLAEDRQERAVGIILSGMGTDGTLGAKVIKGKLGMVMVQDPGSAKCDGMPESAIREDIADFILPPEKMPEQLMRYRESLSSGRISKIGPQTEIPSEALDKVLMLLRSGTGHDFSHYKRNSILRRIERRIKIHQISEISTYVRYLQENPKEVTSLFRDLLIGVTSFLRDPEAFEALKEKALLPCMKEIEGKATLRMWVPGCSTGEEAYSLAMITRECMEQTRSRISVQIFATDLDESAIGRARGGVFSAGIAGDLGKRRLKRFFDREDETYRAKRQIREMLIFSTQSVIKDPPFSKLDVISCRNLLIYLDAEAQKKLMPLFHYSLNPGGILFLGSAETVGTSMDLFSPLDVKWRIYRRKDTSLSTRARMELPFIAPAPVRFGPSRNKPDETDLSHLVKEKILKDYAPSSVVIDPEGRIHYFHGRTGRYLEPAQGKSRPSNILEMARKGLRLALPSLIRKAMSQGEDVKAEGVQVRQNGEFRTVDVTVGPLDQPEAEGLLMVVFQDVPTPPKESKKKPGGKTDTRAKEVEEELERTKHSLRSTIEELETANEELRSSNEEYQSSIEELQSSNEELNSSKEEMYSLNEELQIVNTELRGSNEALVKSHNDFRNLLDSMEVPTIFLDTQLRVMRFTPYINRVSNLKETDMGRPMTDIAQKFKYKNLVEDAKEVLDTLVPKRIEIETEERRWYSVKIRPYRTDENVIEGVAIVFIDIHDLKLLEISLREERNLARNIINTVREPLLILDEKLRVASANQAFYWAFKTDPNSTENRFLYELANGQWDIPELRELLERMLPEKKALDDYEVEGKFPAIGRRKMHLNARMLLQEERGLNKILLAIEDITERQVPGTTGK
jgi:two-component system CheB/CheR fusion protein